MKNSKTKKILSILLAVIMVVGMIPATAIPVGAATISGTTGTGTEADPIIVDTFSELKNALEYAGDVYVKVTKDITCTETIFIPNNGKKTLLIDNTLTSNEVIFNCCDGAKFVLKGNGKFVSKEACLYLNDSDTSVWTEGDLIFESEASPVLSSSGRLYVNGGTFTSAKSASIYPVNGNSYGSLYVYVTRGAFPEGVVSLCGSIKTNSANSIAFNDDGEKLAAPVTDCPIWVYYFGFATYEDNAFDIVPGKTVSATGFGTYGVGDSLAKKTIGFTTYKLPQMAIDAGFSIKENLKITSTNRGVILDQDSGQNYKTDNSVVDNYSIKTSMALIGPNGDVIIEGTVKYSLAIIENAKNITGTIYGVDSSDKITVSLYRYEDNKLYDQTSMKEDCTYLFTGVEPGKYTVKVTGSDYFVSTAVVTVVDKIVNFDFTLTPNKYDIKGTIEGVNIGTFGDVYVRLYESKEKYESGDTSIQGQRINSDGSYILSDVESGKTYYLVVNYKGEKQYASEITVNVGDVIKNIVLHLPVNLSGYATSRVQSQFTVNVYSDDSGELIATTKTSINNNGSYKINQLTSGYYYVVEVIAPEYKTYKERIYLSGNTTLNVDMEYIVDESSYGFASQFPAISAEEIIKGHTDLGLVNTLPTFRFTAKELPSNMKKAGYTVKTQTQVKYSSGGIETLDSTTWTCGNYFYGTNEVTQIVMLIDPDGNEVGRKTHTYTFTYAKLYFETRTPGVTNEQAAAGFSDLGALTTAPKFAFSAYPLSSDLTKEGYSQTVKMEAYQGDKLVYSADNGNTYIHIYPGEGTVFQTIYLLNADGEVVDSVSHAYTFTVDFPEGTIALDADFLTLAENSTHQLSATFAPESLAETLVWTSSNHAVARVDSNGKITAVRPGSVLITATLGNGATAYCAVLVTADDVKAYVGGIGLAEGEYLAQGANVPTTVKPADNYAYLATVNGKLTLTLHNYSYSGMGTFTSKNAAYGIYSTQELKVVAEGKNTIGPMSAPVDRYTSYGIGKGDTVSITSDANSVLNITGVSTAISSSRYVMVSGNLNITDVTSGISCTHAQSMGGLNFQSGNVNIDCTGTAISVTGNYINFSGADVTINCKAGINLVRQGEITIDSGSLKMYASASGINVKSGLAMTVNGGTAYIEAVNNAVALEGALNINGGSIVLISTDTASDSSYSALYGAGTVTLGSAVTGIASTGSTTSSTTSFNSANIKTYDYVCFRDSGYVFVKQPVGGEVKGGGTMTVTWQTGFKPVKLELVTYNGKTTSITTLTASATSSQLGVLPEGGYYQLRAYYSTSYYITSDKFYVYSMSHTVTFDSGVASQKVADGELAVKPSDPEKDNKFFYGWLTPDGKVFDFSTPITEDLVLKAGWADVMVDGVAMPNGSYRGMYSSTATTGRPSGSYAHYKDGVLTLYNYNNSSGRGIEFGEIDLTVVSTGESNAVSCIVSDYDYANLTIDGTAQLNVGHSQWMYGAIQVYNTITFKCDTIVECIDCVAIADTEAIIVEGADVIIKGYADMAWANGIYGCEAPITVFNGSLYLYCEGGDIITDSYIANPDRVTVYANNNLDGVFTDDDIIAKVDEAYDLESYTQIKIVSKSYILSGSISSQLNDTDTITIELWNVDSSSLVYTTTVTGNNATYSVPVTGAGNYELVVTKDGHIPYCYSFEANIEEKVQDIELNLYADTNLDGVIDVEDYQALINAVLSDDHEQIDTAEYDDLIHYDLAMDGYLDVIDAAIMALVVNGHRTIDEVYDIQKGDYDYDGEAYTESDLIAMYHVLSDIDSSAPTLSTSQKFASDLNYNGKVDEDDLAILTGRYGTIESTTCEENIKVYYRWGNSYTTCTATAICTICDKHVAKETVNSVKNADGSYTATFTNTLLGTKTFKKQ